MRVREARQASLPAPPGTLLWFTQSWRPEGRGPGMDAYPDRAAWLAARREWETRHGMTIAEWSEATWEELRRRARSLDEFNASFALIMFEEDDWQDLRTWTSEQMAAGREAALREVQARRSGTYLAEDLR